MPRYTASCRLPCVTADAEDIPGVIPDFGTDAATSQPATDENLVVAAGDTNAVIGTWEQLLAADETRLGASVANTDGAATIYILQQDTGVPASGTQPGEVAVAAGQTYTFPVIPRRRYVVRSTVVSSPYLLTTW